MGLIDLSTYKPVSGTNADANQVANGFQTLQNVINGGIDNNNFAAGKIFDNTKIMQGGAALGQGLVWNGTSWVPASLAGTDVGKTVSGANTDLTIATGNGPLCYSTITTGGGTLRSVAAGAYTGQRLVIRNVHASAVTLKHQLAGGTGAQLFMRGAADVALAQYESSEFVYDGTNWVEVSRDAAPAVVTELAYNEITGNVSISATTGPTANTVVTASAVTFDGATPVMIEFYTPDLVEGSNSITVVLYDGSTELGWLDFQNAPGGSGQIGKTVKRRLTPSAASHTYSIRAYVDAGTGTVDAGAGAAGQFMPAFIRITKAV